MKECQREARASGLLTDGYSTEQQNVSVYRSTTQEAVTFTAEGVASA